MDKQYLKDYKAGKGTLFGRQSSKGPLSLEGFHMLMLLRPWLKAHLMFLSEDYLAEAEGFRRVCHQGFLQARL